MIGFTFSFFSTRFTQVRIQARRVANFDVPRPLVPAGNWAGKGWTVWQYTSKGRARGIDGNVDRNRLKKGFGKLEPR